mgnify:CR=1 FL=1
MEIIDIVLILGCLYSVYTDMRTKKIKNYITFPLMLLGLIYNLYINGLGGLVFSLKGLFISGGLTVSLALIGGFGMGDVKLFMGIGAIKGYKFTSVVLVISLFSSILGSFVINPKRFIEGIKNVYNTIKYKLHHVSYKITEKESSWVLAYGIYIFIGLILTYILGGESVWVKLFAN